MGLCVCILDSQKDLWLKIKKVNHNSYRKRMFCQKEEKNLENTLFTGAKGKVHSRKRMFGNLRCSTYIPWGIRVEKWP